MKHCWSFLLLVALSGSFSASAAEPLPTPPPGAGVTVVPSYYTQTKPWEAPEPVHVCKMESIRAATPTADFIDNRDGTVTHRRTGLVWMRCALGQNWDGKSCAGQAEKYIWGKALQAAVDINAAGGYAGKSDWRVPNVKELESIAELQCIQPAINLAVFPATPPVRFWSSSLFTMKNSGSAWFVNFEDGYTDDGRVGNPDSAAEVIAKFAYPIRLVRGGQPFDSFDAGSPKRQRGTKK